MSNTILTYTENDEFVELEFPIDNQKVKDATLSELKETLGENIFKYDNDQLLISKMYHNRAKGIIRDKTQQILSIRLPNPIKY